MDGKWRCDGRCGGDATRFGDFVMRKNNSFSKQGAKNMAEIQRLLKYPITLIEG